MLAVGRLYLSSRVSGGTSAFDGVPVDDTWIHLVYARSLAEHGRFFYNEGVQESGMSSPFWVVLLAVAYKLGSAVGLSAPWCAKATSALCAFGGALAMQRLAWTASGSRIVSFCAGLFVVLEPNLAYSHWSGMEVALASLFLVLAVHAAWREHYGVCGVVLGLLVVTRGEGVPIAVFITAVVLVHRLLVRGMRPRLARADMVIAFQLLAPAFVLGGLWALYNLHVAGRPLPNTYYAKHDDTLGLLPLVNWRAILTGYFARVSFLRGPATWLAAGFVAAALFHFRSRRRWREFALVVGVPLLYVYLNVITIAYYRIDQDKEWTYYWRRYLDVALPFGGLWMAIGAWHAWELLPERRKRAGRACVLAAGPALIVAMLELHGARIAEYSWDTENIENVDVAMGTWLGASLPEDAVIAVTDAGAMRFLTKPTQRIVDLLALNCAPCAQMNMEERFRTYAAGYAVLFVEGLPMLDSFTELKTFKPGKLTMLGGAELHAVQITQSSAP
ncbi:hypothetical protein LVJ94_41525 [Pendulispora rubella]|uniref:Glycosyltransferase RgtA/B/C/D-like domain-containing protein n=1 Tax=Pendulispora rubella TaxID=2741070 RepID=A0ABZ2L055_9BACT